MADVLISDYLGRLDAAAWPLPPSRRSELTAEVREHIETALAEAGSRDEAAVRNVLDRLGRPEDIVAAEAEAEGASFRPPVGHAAGAAASGWLERAASRGWGPVEIVAVLLLTVGAFLLWWAGPIAGAVVSWFSERWTSDEKRLAGLVVFGLLAVQVLVLAFFMTEMFSFGGLGFGGAVMPSFGLMGLLALLSALLPWAAGLGAGIYLALAIQRRT